MARAKPGPVTPRAIPRARGSFLGYVHRGGIVYQKWPRKRGKAKSGGLWYKQREFGMVAAWASETEPIGYQSAIELVKGTDNVPRDLIMSTSFGTFYKVFLPDGTEASYYRMVAPNAQLILDQVTDEVGSLIYRAPIGWVQVPTGSNGQVLAIIDTVPQWQDVYPVAIADAEILVGQTEPTLPNSRTLIGSDSVIVDYDAPGDVIVTRAEITGDVTIDEDSNTAEIPADTVTYSQLQNVTASQRLLGRNSSGAGNVEELDTTTVRSMLGVGGGGAVQVPYFAESEIYITPPAVSGTGIGTATCVANQIWFAPISIPWQRTFTSIAISIPVGGSVAGSNARLGIYAVDQATGRPGAVLIDAGNVTTASTGLRAISISQLLDPGQYYAAIWTSANINIRQITAAFGIAQVACRLGNATPHFVASMTRNQAFGTAFANESAQTHTLIVSGGTPLLGLR